MMNRWTNKKLIEKTTGKKVQLWSRNDGGNVFEAGASCLPSCEDVYSFSYADTKSIANYRILLKLAEHHGVQLSN